MTETTTLNGHEILNPVDRITAGEFKAEMAEVYRIDGSSPAERIEQLKDLSVEGIAIMLEDINKSVQGSDDSLMSHGKVMEIGKQKAIPIEDRYDVFAGLIESIKSAPEDINPARIADTLALGVVLIHPFQDGNGRTARLVGLLFRDRYDGSEYESDFEAVSEPRDETKSKGDFLISGYAPKFEDGFDQSDAQQVSGYLDRMLTEEAEGAYDSCYSQASLHGQGEAI